MVHSVFGAIKRGVGAASRGVAVISGITLVFMTLLTVFDVFLRAVFDYSIHGAIELTEFSLGIIVFLALAFCGVQNGHIVIDILVKRISRPFRIVIGTVISFFSACMLGLLGYRMVVQAMRVYSMGQTSVILDIPVYPFVLVGAFGCALLALVYLIKSFSSLEEQ